MCFLPLDLAKDGTDVAGDVMEHSTTNAGATKHESKKKGFSSSSDGELETRRIDEVRNSSKMHRLLGWSVDVLSRTLKKVVASRNGVVAPHCERKYDNLKADIGKTLYVIYEVTEFVELRHTNNDHTDALDGVE